MKTYFSAILILGLSLSSCLENSSPIPIKKNISTTDSINNTTPPINNVIDSSNSNSNLDSITEVDLPAKNLFNITILDSLALQLHLALKENPDNPKTYKENIPFTSFLGEPIEIGELEISTLNNQKHIHADYFDGAPMGAKKFLLQDGNLFCIEIINLQEQVTENGSVISEKTTHKFYYENDSLMEIIDNTSNTSLLDSTIIWKDENWNDWEVIKKHL